MCTATIVTKSSYPNFNFLKVALGKYDRLGLIQYGCRKSKYIPYSPLSSLASLLGGPIPCFPDGWIAIIYYEDGCSRREVMGVS